MKFRSNVKYVNGTGVEKHYFLFPPLSKVWFVKSLSAQSRTGFCIWCVIAYLQETCFCIFFCTAAAMIKTEFSD